MYGQSVNTLDVQLWAPDNKFEIAWQKNGSQGDSWQQASIQIGDGTTSISKTVSTKHTLILSF